MAIQLAKRLLTIDEYHRMAEAHILTDEDKVELLHGEIIEMSPIGSEHSACVKRLNAFFNQLLVEKAIVSVQDPIQLPSLSEPEPDIALLHPRLNFYADAHPLPKDVFLVIEVADSSLLKDRQVKLPIYASAGIPEYWIINLEQKRVEAYRHPRDNQYLSQTISEIGEKVHLAAFGVDIACDQLLMPS